MERTLRTVWTGHRSLFRRSQKINIIDITRTGAAKDIREAIKYLNEKKLKPTQERLGVSYIERDEDANPIDEENTSALFQIFG